MSLDEQFKAAAEKLQSFTKRPTNDELLQAYALFKQGSFGDNNTNKPGMLDMKAKAKWDAWNNQKSKTQDDAKKEYINFVESIAGEYK